MYGMSTGFYLKEIEELSSKITKNRKEINDLNKKLRYEDYSYYIEEYEKRIDELEKDNVYRAKHLVEEAEDFYLTVSCKGKDSWLEKKVLQYIFTVKSRLEDKKEKESDEYKVEYAFDLAEYLHKGYAIFRETPMEEETCNELVFVSDNVFDTWRYIEKNMKSYIEGVVLRVKEVGGVWVTGKRVKG